MPDPKLAEVLNPRLTQNRRMSKEGQEMEVLPDKLPSANGSPGANAFTRKWTSEERAKQNAQLAELLSKRQ